MNNEFRFDSVIINNVDHSFQIINGTKGTFYLNDIKKCEILNEKATKKNKIKPFSALMPGKGLPTGILSTPYLFVGIKIMLKNEKVLAIYISKEKTQVGTDQYEKDRNEAKKIKSLLISSKVS